MTSLRRIRYLLKKRSNQFNLYLILRCIYQCSRESYFTYSEYDSRKRMHFRKAKLFFGWLLNVKCRCGDGRIRGFDWEEVCDDCAGIAINWQWSLRDWIRSDLFSCRGKKQLWYYEIGYMQRLSRKRAISGSFPGINGHWCGLCGRPGPSMFCSKDHRDIYNTASKGND